jgi:hypothetical protein
MSEHSDCFPLKIRFHHNNAGGSYFAGKDQGSAGSYFAVLKISKVQMYAHQNAYFVTTSYMLGKRP